MGRHCGFAVTVIGKVGENGIPIPANKRWRVGMAGKSLKKRAQLPGRLIVHALEAKGSDSRQCALVNVEGDKKLALLLAQNRRNARLEKSFRLIVSGQSLDIAIEHFLAENAMEAAGKTFRLDGYQRRKFCGGNAAIAAKIISLKGLLDRKS